MKTAAILIAAGGLTAGMALGAGADRGAGKAGRDGKPNAALGLSAEQKTQIHSLRQELRKEQIKARAEVKLMRIEMDELMRAQTLDEAAIRAKGKQLAEAQAALAQARLDHRLAVAKLLTPEQREKWQDLDRRWRDRHGRDGRDRGMRRGSRSGDGGMAPEDGPEGPPEGEN